VIRKGTILAGIVVALALGGCNGGSDNSGQAAVPKDTKAKAPDMVKPSGKAPAPSGALSTGVGGLVPGYKSAPPGSKVAGGQ